MVKFFFKFVKMKKIMSPFNGTHSELNPIFLFRIYSKPHFVYLSLLKLSNFVQHYKIILQSKYNCQNIFIVEQNIQILLKLEIIHSLAITRHQIEHVEVITPSRLCNDIQNLLTSLLKSL